MPLVSTLCTLTGRRELMSARLRKHAGKTARVQLAKKKHQDCSSIKITPSVREKKAWYPIACVTSVSVRFRSKEWRTRVKGRAKNGASKTAAGKGWVMVRNLGSISADFRRLPGPVFHPLSSFGGMSAGSFSRTAAGNRAIPSPGLRLIVLVQGGDELVNRSYRDRAADDLGHRDVTRNLSREL